jgi:hypothetical protein
MLRNNITDQKLKNILRPIRRPGVGRLKCCYDSWTTLWLLSIQHLPKSLIHLILASPCVTSWSVPSARFDNYQFVVKKIKELTINDRWWLPVTSSHRPPPPTNNHRPTPTTNGHYWAPMATTSHHLRNLPPPPSTTTPLCQRVHCHTSPGLECLVWNTAQISQMLPRYGNCQSFFLPTKVNM